MTNLDDLILQDLHFVLVHFDLVAHFGQLPPQGNVPVNQIGLGNALQLGDIQQSLAGLFALHDLPPQLGIVRLHFGHLFTQLQDVFAHLLHGPSVVLQVLHLKIDDPHRAVIKLTSGWSETQSNQKSTVTYRKLYSTQRKHCTKMITMTQTVNQPI